MASNALSSSSPSSHLSAFSQDGQYFAIVVLAVDKHRLRVYSTSTSSVVADLIPHAHVSSIEWTSTSSSGEQSSPSKKRRKGSTSSTKSPQTTVVALGLSDGSILLFSPSHGKTVQTLSNAASTSPIAALSRSASKNVDNACRLFSVSSDNVIRLWDTSANSIQGTWSTDDRVPYTCIRAYPSAEGEDADSHHLLVANTTVKLLNLEEPDAAVRSSTSPLKIKPESTFTGHASPIQEIHCDVEYGRFITMSQSDRIMYVWSLEQTGTMAASIPLDSKARAASFNPSNHTVAVVSSLGTLSLVPVPSELVTSGKQKVPSLSPRSVITSKGKAQDVIAGAFQNPRSIHVVRLINGARPVVSLVDYLNDSDSFVSEITLRDPPALTTQESQLLRTKKYAEPQLPGVHSGGEIGLEQDADPNAVDGDLDVEIAELSLGQRLTALNGEDAAADDADDTDSKQKHPQHGLTVVPASSLTRTLIQALHSSDARLLETCLAHSSAELITNTVRRLPPQLAEPLIKACVERLGRGARAGEMKGGGGGASSQRGMSLITWVKAVLTIHSGHLMTIHDLVPRLSGLHATLTSRLALQQSLLSLSGRLEMVLSQIELRSSTTPAPLGLNRAKPSQSVQSKNKGPLRYVEGESGDEADEMDVEEDDEGSVEDIELGGDSADEDDDEEFDDEEADDDSDEDPTMNGFIDDEAEEDSGEEEDEDSD